MKIKNLLCILALSTTFSSFAYADITVTNNTNSVATGGISYFCSSMFDNGIIWPHHTVPITQDIIDNVCSGSCDIRVYMNDNCSGDSIATLHVNHLAGVTSIDNHNNPDNYHVSGGGNMVVVEGGSMNRFSKWFKIFS